MEESLPFNLDGLKMSTFQVVYPCLFSPKVNSSMIFIGMKLLYIKAQCFSVYIYINLGFLVCFSGSVSFIEYPYVEYRINYLHVF